MKIDPQDIQPSSALEDALAKLNSTGHYIQLRLYHFLAEPADEYNAEMLYTAIDQHTRAAQSVFRAIAARQAVDRDMPRIAQAVREGREGEDFPSEEELHP